MLVDTLIEKIGMIQVPGEGDSWNCQDYVMDIWDVMRCFGMIDNDTWEVGKVRMMPDFGQDFGGSEDEEDSTDVDERQ